MGGKYKASAKENYATYLQTQAAKQEAQIAGEQWAMAKPIYKELSTQAMRPVEDQSYFKRMIGGLERDYGNVGANTRRTLAGRYQYGSGYEGEAQKNLELSKAGARAGAWQSGEETRRGFLTNLASGGVSSAQQGYAASGGISGDIAGRLANLRIQKAAQQTGAASSGMGSMASMCCWIFIKGEMLNDNVRRFRDHLFHPNSFVAKGYKKMAWWLIPLMDKHPTIMKIVRAIMLRPIKNFSDTCEIKYLPTCIFWTIIWHLYGRVAKIMKREALWRAYPRHEYYNYPEEITTISPALYGGIREMINLAIQKKLKEIKQWAL